MGYVEISTSNTSFTVMREVSVRTFGRSTTPVSERAVPTVHLGTSAEEFSEETHPELFSLTMQALTDFRAGRGKRLP